MTAVIKDIVQWLHHKAPNSKDPRARFFPQIFASATFDPHSLRVARMSNGSLRVEAELVYTNIKSKGGAPTPFHNQRADVAFELSEASINGRVLFSKQSMYELPLEFLLGIWKLYTIFSDQAKLAVFMKLVPKEIP